MDPQKHSDAKKFKPGWQVVLAFISITILNLAMALDATATSVAMPTIMVTLDGNAVHTFWAWTSFLLASMVWQANLVRASHLLGHRVVLIATVIMFAIGAIFCAVSINLAMMLFGRTIQGISCGGVIALTDIFITDVISLHEQKKYIALISFIWAAGCILGPMLGAILAQAGTWRWIFYINLSVLTVGFLGIVKFLNFESRKLSLMEKLLEHDEADSVTFFTLTTSTSIHGLWGSIAYICESCNTVVPIIFGLFGLFLLAVQEVKYAKCTHRPFQLFKSISTYPIYCIASIHGIILWAVLYYIPLYFKATKPCTPDISSGLNISDITKILSVIPYTIVLGGVITKTKYYRALWAGWAMATIGISLLHLLTPFPAIPTQMFFTFACSVGIGLLFPTMALAVPGLAPSKIIVNAAAMFTFFCALGQIIGAATGGIVFQSCLEAKLTMHPSSDGFAAASSVNVVGLIETANPAPNADSRTMTFENSVLDSILWVMLSSLAGMALVLPTWIKHYNLNQKLVAEISL